MTIRTTPVEGRRVWTAQDAARDPNIWELSTYELAEVEAARAAVRAKGLTSGQFERDDFPLSAMATRIDAVREELLAGRGYVVMRHLPVEQYSVEDLEIIYYGLGLHLGQIVSQNGRGDVLTHVTDHGFAPGNPNVRGYQDRRSQPPHTDPTDVVALLCIRKALSGGASSVINVGALYNEMLATCPQHLETLYRGFYMDMRGEGSEGDSPAGTTPIRVPIFSYHNGVLSSWFARRVFDSAFAKRGETPTPEETAALDAFEQLSQRDEFTAHMELQPGDIQWVNNYAVMHARTSFEDHPEVDRKRLMVRLWLNIPEQDLAPDFASVIRRGIPRTASGKLGAEIGEAIAH